MTDLSNLKNQYILGEITGIKLFHTLKLYKNELSLLYPDVENLMSMAYLYINNKDRCESYCDKSKRNRRLLSLKDGFLTYCGNQSVCVCNKENKQLIIKNRTDDDIQTINTKRSNTNIEKYGVEFASKTQKTKDKTARTCLARYGTISPTQNPLIFAKVKATILENWGVEYPHQNSELASRAEQTWLEVRGVIRPAQDPIVMEKMKTTMLARYGFDHNMKIPDIVANIRYKNKIKSYNIILDRSSADPLFSLDEFTSVDSMFACEWKWKCKKCNNEFLQAFRPGKDVRCLTCAPLKESSGERDIRHWLDNHNIQYIQNNRKTIKPYELDFYLPNLNIAIEFNGIYWHSEQILNDDKYHFNKFTRCKAINIKLIQIWEHDLIHKKEIIFSRLSHVCNIGSQRSIGARKCSIIPISPQLARPFLNEYHLQGFRPSGHYYGCYFNNNLIAVMSIGKPRYNENIDYELTRYAVKSDINLIGGVSKILANVKRDLGNIRLLSYADLCWGNGNVYEKTGFVFQNYSQPNFFYFKTVNDVRSRDSLQKHKILGLADGNTGQEIISNLGYNRFFDAGNSVWIKQL